MGFFAKLDNIVKDGFDLNLTIRKEGNHMMVAVLPKPQVEVKDVNIPPLVFTGSAHEIDQVFMQNLQQAKTSAKEACCNLSSFQKSLKKDNSKKEKGKDDKNQSSKQDSLF